MMWLGDCQIPLSHTLTAICAAEGAAGTLQVISDTVVPASAEVVCCRLHGSANSGAQSLLLVIFYVRQVPAVLFIICALPRHAMPHNLNI